MHSDFDPLALEEEDDDAAVVVAASQGHAILRVAYVPSRSPTAAKALLVRVAIACNAHACDVISPKASVSLFLSARIRLTRTAYW